MRYSNERGRGDSALSAQRPHLLPFFLLPVSVWISCLSIEDALCFLCPGTGASLPPTLHKYQMGRDYIPLLAFRLDSRLKAECHAVNLQFKLNCGFVSCLWAQTVLTFRSPAMFVCRTRVTLKSCSLKSVFGSSKNKSSLGLAYRASNKKKREEPAAVGQRSNITDGKREDVTASWCRMRAAKEISVNAHPRVERESGERRTDVFT